MAVSSTSAPSRRTHAPLQVDAQVADAAARRDTARCVLGAAQHGPHARHQLARAERLGQIVVGAQLQADQPVGLLHAGGEHDDRQAVGGRVLAQGAGDVEAVQAGQHQVEHQQVGPLGAGQAQGGRAVARRQHAKARPVQIVAHDGHDARLVVHHEDGPVAVGPRSPGLRITTARPFRRRYWSGVVARRAACRCCPWPRRRKKKNQASSPIPITGSRRGRKANGPPPNPPPPPNGPNPRVLCQPGQP